MGASEASVIPISSHRLLIRKFPAKARLVSLLAALRVIKGNDNERIESRQRSLMC
jgi:hypothetical protein